MSEFRTEYTVSLTINACKTDGRFLDKIVRHLIRTMNYPFVQRLIAYDAGSSEGRFSEQNLGNDQQMAAILRDLVSDGVIDRVDDVPWDRETECAIMKKYFNREDIERKEAQGSPIYQYLYALDRCTGDYLFHIDSDMLFHWTTAHSWIDEAIAILQQNPLVVFAAPTSGPPQVETWLEKVLARPVRKKRLAAWILNGEIVSTRFFLLDKNRFEREVLPLCPERPGELLEKTIGHTLKLRGRHIAWQMDSVENWVIHPLTHGDEFSNHLSDLIWAVEKGVYPFNRKGFRWDMYTEGADLKPWLRAIRQARLEVRSRVEADESV